MAEHYVETGVAIALDRLKRQILPWFDQWSVIADIRFLAANQSLDVAHGMPAGVIPDGFSVVIAEGPVYAAPGMIWTDKVAYLQTSASNIRATVVFYTLRAN